MRAFITPREFTCDFRLRDLGWYLKLNLRLQRKIMKHLWRNITWQKRIYRVRSQISGEVLASTDSLECARAVSRREGFITWGEKKYARRYVTNEDGLVVYAPS